MVCAANVLHFTRMQDYGSYSELQKTESIDRRMDMTDSVSFKLQKPSDIYH